jgi:acetyl-CoA carboxylase biotin carboxyl carrier protein
MDEEIISADLKGLLDQFCRSGVRELHVRRGSFELYLSNDPNASSSPRPVIRRPAKGATESVVAPPPALAPRRPVAPAALPEDAFIVKAPNLGTFYRAPKPGAAAYVELGAQIGQGAELCLIEVMKLFTTVRAERGGRLHSILAEDGTMVEAGQPLFAIVPAP